MDRKLPNATLMAFGVQNCPTALKVKQEKLVRILVMLEGQILARPEKTRSRRDFLNPLAKTNFKKSKTALNIKNKSISGSCFIDHKGRPKKILNFL